MSVHLVVLIHGLYGSPANLAVVEEEIIRAGSEQTGLDPPQVLVHVCKSFTGSHTWDGIDVNAWKASKEVDEVIEKVEEGGKVVSHFSVVGYSLGGLVARYLVGLLHSRSPSFFNEHKTAAFGTAATPHLGVLKYGTRTNTLVHTVGRRLFSRSGQQLYCLDKDWEGRAVLEVLADPDHIFVQALTLFPSVIIAANGCHDLTVPYPTATFSLHDPFEAFDATGMQVDVDEHNIVRSWQYDTGTKDVRVTVSEQPTKTRPFFPPILYLRWPFTYLLFALLPFILPLWFCFVTCLMTLHTLQSRWRHRKHLSSSSNDPARTPLLGRSPAPSRPITGTNTPSMSIRSGTSTPNLIELALPDDIPPRKGQTALLLTPSQKIMCRNLQQHLPHAERIIGWYPWAYNSHATLVVRDAKRFKTHEEGRGVVKALAKSVVNAI